MKKTLILITIASIATIFAISISAKKSKKIIPQTDLAIINDTNDRVSTEAMFNGKKIIRVFKPGEKISGGRGFIRIHVAKRDGIYEMSYTFPRQKDMPTLVKLTDLMASTREIGMTDQDIRTEKGMMHDIQVFYEEITAFSEE